MKPAKAIGIEIGNNGWKKIAVKNKFAVFENLFAISSVGPSHKLNLFYEKNNYLHVSLSLSHDTLIAFASLNFSSNKFQNVEHIEIVKEWINERN